MKKALLILLLINLSVSCKKSLPPELQHEREWVNIGMEEFIRKEEKSEDYRKSTRIQVDLDMLRKNTLRYKEMLESKGYGGQFNSDALAFIDEKITKYVNNGKSIYKETSTRHTCNICGKRFVGRGYTEVSTGLWQLTKEPLQSFICSRGCGAVHTERQIKRIGF
ncbi:hypothetical protein Q4Q34_18490 [Flavivirga abyssicola]|uniref:hypothetical protein n=1 Tax=Flavivirga abyssicola TaxID=3063533 RepID=UPI0026E0A814|nr:hypothetical protein [Flavivirga sp. MEBiC07777]WVK13205.1 hypothetical protein Q4Q34_18490 [Flavivirga sp. MEBiC07777]